MWRRWQGWWRDNRNVKVEEEANKIVEEEDGIKIVAEEEGK